MFYQRFKILTAGIIIGSLCTLGIQVFAEPASNIVTAFVSNMITFEFDGVKKELPAGYNILTYRDRTYVPIRFVAENLGAEVDWINDTQTIKLISALKTDDKVCDEPKDIQDEKISVTRNFQKLPQNYNDMDMLLGVSVVTKDDKDERRVYITLENKKITPLQLIQSETKIVVDGIEYYRKDVPAFRLDDRWYKDVQQDGRTEGYITLPKLHRDPKELQLTLVTLKNDSKREKQKVEFNILME